MKIQLIYQNLKCYPRSEHDQMKLWVFWDPSQPNEGDVDDKLKIAFSNVEVWDTTGLVQLWTSTPNATEMIWLLSPFAVTHVTAELGAYRQKCMKNESFKTEGTNVQNTTMPSDGPIATLSRGIPTAHTCPYLGDSTVNTHPYHQTLSGASIMLPIKLDPEGYNIGVIEMATKKDGGLGDLTLNLIRELEKVGLEMVGAEDLMTLKFEEIEGLKDTAGGIQEALIMICEEHNLRLAQVWVAHQLQSTNETVALKMAGFIGDVNTKKCNTYFELSNKFPQTEGGVICKTLEDARSRFAHVFYSEMMETFDGNGEFNTGALTVGLTALNADEIIYVFEFVGLEEQNDIKPLLSTMRIYLPNFRFLSGEELGCNTKVTVVANGKDKEETIDIFHGKMKLKPRRSGLIKSVEKDLGNIESFKGKIIGVEGNNEIFQEERKLKPRKSGLTKDAVEKEFGKTLKDAARNLNVSETTLKDFKRELGIKRWPGPSFMDRKKIDPTVQIYENQKVKDVAVESRVENWEKKVKKELEKSRIGQNAEEVVTVVFQAIIGEDKVVFRLKSNEVNLEVIKTKIDKRSKHLINRKILKIKYHIDQYGEWFLIADDEDIQEHIKSLKSKNGMVDVVIRVEFLEDGGESVQVNVQHGV